MLSEVLRVVFQGLVIWEARYCPVVKMFLDLVTMKRFVLSGLSEPWFRMQSGGTDCVGSTGGCLCVL